jgi:uncharacterized protein YciI
MYFALTRQRGSNWDDSRPMREQENWAEHAAFMDALVEEGFVVLGGPLGDETNWQRALLIVDTDSEDTIHARLAADPWTPMQMLTTDTIDRWEILLGDRTRR